MDFSPIHPQQKSPAVFNPKHRPQQQHAGSGGQQNLGQQHQQPESQQQQPTPPDPQAFILNGTSKSNNSELSLRAHIEQHLKTSQQPEVSPRSGVNTESPTDLFNRAETVSTTTSPSTEPVKRKKPTFTRPAQVTPHHAGGHQLFGLDTELNAGIEPLLPTASTRLRIQKERMAKERAELEKQLTEYQAITSPSNTVVEKISTLRKKLLTLKRHESHVNYKLTRMFSQGSGVFRLWQQWNQVKATSAQWLNKVGNALNVKQLLYQVDPTRAKVNNLNTRLNELTHVLNTQMAQKTLQSDELSDVMNQYDRTLKRVNTLQAELPTTGNLWEHVQYFMKRIRKRISSNDSVNK